MDKIHYLVHGAADAGSVAHLEAQSFRHLQALVVGLGREVVAGYMVEVGVETAFANRVGIQELEGAGCGVAGIGEERLFVGFALAVDALEVSPRQQHFAANL